MREGAIPITLLTAGVLLAQTPDVPPDLNDVDNTIQSLRQVSRDLSETVRLLNSHLDEAASKFDRGYRSVNGVRMPGADSDLTSPVEIVMTAVRKGMAYRMLAARNERYQPAAVTDLDRIQQLIAEARKRADDSSTVLRKLLVVSSRDIAPQKDAAVKARHNQLLKARAAAEQAADEAYLSLPVEAEASALDQNGGPFGNLSVQATPRRQTGTQPSPGLPKPGSKTPLPLYIEHRKRVTLVNNTWCRVALTDSGTEDENGRRLFYEEEWLQRGDVVIRLRWRVAVDTTTGQHVLLKRYPLVELAGSLTDLYEQIDRQHLWYIEPPEGAKEPSREDLDRALTGVGESRAAVENAAAQFSATVRTLLARHDQQSAAENKFPLDAGLPDPLRASLFAIRADLGKVSAVIDAEKRVRRSIAQTANSVAALEPLAAWANVTSSAEWDKVSQRSDREIDLLYAAENEAARTLPPDMSKPEAQFPALEKNVIVRIRRLASPIPNDGTVRCLQEIWRMETPMPGTIKVRRTAVLVSVDSRTGNQVLVRSRTTYYPAAAGEAVEQVFDENAADDILGNERS